MIQKYREVDAMIVRHQQRSLDLAVERLIQRRDLAWQLVNG